MKYLLSAALVVLAFWAWRRNRHSHTKGGPSEAAQSPNQAPKQSQPTAMLACGHCKLHFDSAEAVRGADGTPFCSAKHLQLGQR